MASTTNINVTTEFDAADLRALTEHPAAPSVSVYMPLYPSPPESQQNAVRLRNLLRRAHELVDKGEFDSGAAKDLADEFAAASDGIDDLVAEPSGGLALFLRAGLVQAYKLRMPFDELVVASLWFHVTPLVEWIQGNGRFFVLAVSQKDVRLLQGTKHDLAEVDLEGLPKNLVEALNIDEYVQSIQFHTSGFGGRDSIDSGGGMFHGHAGSGQGDKKLEITEFFRRLDDALVAHLRDDDAPLVFAGVDYLFPIYQQVNHYRGLASEPIAGNPEGFAAHQLHEPAWKIVSRSFDAARIAASEQYGALAARARASDKLAEIVPNAHIGRVGTLLVERGAQRRGVVDPDTGEVRSEGDPGVHEDLVNSAASRTIMAGGAVYLLDKAEMPTPGPAAALYRY